MKVGEQLTKRKGEVSVGNIIGLLLGVFWLIVTVGGMVAIIFFFADAGSAVSDGSGGPGFWLLLFGIFSIGSIVIIKANVKALQESRKWKKEKVRRYGLVVDVYVSNTNYYGEDEYCADIIIDDNMPLYIYEQKMGLARFSLKKGDYLLIDLIEGKDNITIIKKVDKIEIEENVLNVFRSKYEEYKQKMRNIYENTY